MENTSYFDLSHLTAIQGGLLVLLVALALFFLVKAATVVQGYEGSGDNGVRLRAAVITGLHGMAFSTCCVLAIFVVLWSNTGLKEAAILSVFVGACSIPLMFGVATVGSYIQLGWTDRLRRKLDAIAESELGKRRQ